VPTPQSILPYRNALVVNEYEIVGVKEGEYAAPHPGGAVGHPRLAGAAHRAPDRRAVHRLTLERYDAHPELEGERLIRAAGLELPLYYDLGS
jgi:hypothetical protein